MLGAIVVIISVINPWRLAIFQRIKTLGLQDEISVKMGNPIVTEWSRPTNAKKIAQNLQGDR